MKDKQGQELPEPREEYIGHIGPEWGNIESVCHNCNTKQRVGTTWTLRVYNGNSRQARAQGPLCPQCSELPPENLPSRKLLDRWW